MMPLFWGKWLCGSFWGLVELMVPSGSIERSVALAGWLPWSSPFEAQFD